MMALALVLLVSVASPDPAPAQDPPEVVSLGQRLRCPVCQGMPIGDSPAPMAQDMMKTVRRLAEEGQTTPQIEAFFTARYGDWVLLDPPKTGIGLWVWLLPPTALAAMVVTLVFWLLGRRRPMSPVHRGYGLSAGVVGENVVEPSPSDTADEDLQAIRREVLR